MKTITFYSYKGGVGRSLILANVAKRLTEMGKNVCMLDFDLEAPGLEFKFLEYDIEDKEKGVVDFITSYTKDDILPQDILSYTSEIKIASRKHHGWLKLITAGDIDDDGSYWRKLMSIDWKKLFYTPDGKGYELILHLKALIEQQIKPDYLLVDSRTGITETSGITLSILADEVVIIGANNDENFLGSVLIIKNISANVKGKTPKVNFVLSRVPFTNVPEDRAKEFDRISELKQDFLDEGIDTIDEIYVIHSDRELEAEESLKIGEIEREGEVCIENDYLHFFDNVIKPDLSDEDVKAFEIRAKANKLILDAQDLNDYQEKLKLLDHSIELDPENELAYLERAMVYEFNRNIEKAEIDFLSYYYYSFNKHDFVFWRILKFYNRSKLYSKIIEFSEKEFGNLSLASYLPIRHDSESILGNAYAMLGQYDKAFAIYDRLIKETPNSPKYIVNMAELYLKQNIKIKETEQLLDKAIKINPNHANALINMAIVQSLNNNSEDFYIYLDRALASDKTSYTKDFLATEQEFKKHYKEEAFQRILYKYNIRLKTE